MVVGEFARKYRALIMVVLLIGLWAMYYMNEQGVDIRTIFESPADTVRIGDVPLSVTVATTSAALTLGLSHRDSLGSTEGMLFIFPKEGYHGIWMKDMNFAIDIIWVDANFTVVGIERNVLPETYPTTFEPPVPVPYVIETKSYFTESFSIKVGDQVQIPSKYLE